jgi:hypothetical protein
MANEVIVSKIVVRRAKTVIQERREIKRAWCLSLFTNRAFCFLVAM